MKRLGACGCHISRGPDILVSSPRLSPPSLVRVDVIHVLSSSQAYTRHILPHSEYPPSSLTNNFPELLILIVCSYNSNGRWSSMKAKRKSAAAFFLSFSQAWSCSSATLGISLCLFSHTESMLRIASPTACMMISKMGRKTGGSVSGIIFCRVMMIQRRCCFAHLR